MREFLMADWLAHRWRLLLMVALPSAFLMWLGAAKLGMHVLAIGVSMFMPHLIALHENMNNGWSLMCSLPLTRRQYIARRFVALWFWFAMLVVWFLLVSIVSNLLHSIPLYHLFNAQALAWGVFLFAVFTGVIEPLLYRFGASAMILLSNSLVVTFVLVTFVIMRVTGSSLLQEALAHTVVPLQSALSPVGFGVALVVAGLAVQSAGYMFSQCVFAHRDL